MSRKEEETQRNLTGLLVLACLPLGRYLVFRTILLYSFFAQRRRVPKIKTLCDLAPLRLCVNKKKNVSQRRGDAKKSNRSLSLACLPLGRYLVLRKILLSSFFEQRRRVPKIKTPLRLGSFAPLREQKKECLPVRRGGLDNPSSF
jgi:hypothetical protein